METRKHIVICTALAASASGSALATVIGNQAFGDSYLVVDGAKTYAVLDVYVKSVNNTQNDRMGSIYGVATSTAGSYRASWRLQEAVGSGSATNSARQFKHAGNSAWRSNYTGGADAGTVDMPDGVTYNLYDHAWDSFVTSGLRYQSNDGGGTTALQLTPTSFTNFGTANAGTIASNTTGTNGGAGWYSLAGSTAGTNPFCQFSYYNGQTGAVNTAKATSSIAGNGITAGQSLDNHYMVARVTLDMADMVAGTTYTRSCKLAMTVVSDGVTKTGSTDTNFRVNQSLTFVSALGCATPPGAAGDCNGNGILDSCERSPTTDSNNDGKLASCQRAAGDLDLSGTIDAGDVGVLLLNFGTCPGSGACTGDLDGSRSVDAADIGMVLLRFGDRP